MYINIYICVFCSNIYLSSQSSPRIIFGSWPSMNTVIWSDHDKDIASKIHLPFPDWFPHILFLPINSARTHALWHQIVRNYILLQLVLSDPCQVLSLIWSCRRYGSTVTFAGILPSPYDPWEWYIHLHLLNLYGKCRYMYQFHGSYGKRILSYYGKSLKS